MAGPEVEAKVSKVNPLHNVSSDERQASDEKAKRVYQPWFAILELVVAVFFIAAAVTLVAVVKDTEVWSSSAGSKISPPVLISLFHSASSFFVGMAVNDCITIAWWRKAQAGVYLRDLSHNYRLGTSMRSAILAGRRFNVIAAVVITAAALSFAQGPLLQRSLNVSIRPATSNVLITTQIASYLPRGYSGIPVTDDGVILSKDFAAVLQAYNRNLPIQPPFTGCNGTCSMTIEAAGFAMDCTTDQQPATADVTLAIVGQDNTDYGAAIWSSNTTELIGYGEAPMFNSKFLTNDLGQFGTGMGGYVPFNQSLTYRSSFVNQSKVVPQGPDNPCADFWSNHSRPLGDTCTTANCTMVNNEATCTLLPAIMEYPIIIQNDTVHQGVVTIDATASPFLHVVRYVNISADDTSNVVAGDYVLGSTLGGIGLALQALFGSNLNISFTAENFFKGHPPQPNTWLAAYNGTIGNNYRLTAGTTGNDSTTGSTCAWDFRDPALDVLSAVNEIMFRTAVAIGTTNSSAVATSLAQQTNFVNYYTAEWAYLAATLALTVVGTCIILASLWRFWELDREVSLDPLELADAFNSPVVQYDDGGEAISGYKDIIRTMGHREVKYGHIGYHVAPENESVRRAVFVRL